MAQSLARLHVHLVFSTKNRTPWLRDPEERASVQAYLAGICNHKDCPALVVGGYDDHVHLLVRMAKDKTAPVLIREIKEISSKWIKKKGPHFEAKRYTF